MALTNSYCPRHLTDRPRQIMITAADHTVDWSITCTDCAGMDVRVLTRDGAIAFGFHHRNATHQDRALVGFTIDP